MIGIVEFLEARIAEDEVKASSLLANTQEGYDINEYAERVLAESAAKRAIIESYQNVSKATKSMNSLDTRLTIGGMEEGLRVAVTALTFPYKDHSDWQKEWAKL